MRTFSGSLLLENIFDFIPETVGDIYKLSMSVFEPNVLIVSADCATTLGKFETINFEAEGLTELATEEVLSEERITELLSDGVYTAATRHTSTCIAKKGICIKCFKATFPDQAIPKINDRVIIKPEYLVNAELIHVVTGTVEYSVITTEDLYDKYYVFSEGLLLEDNVDYTIVGTTVTLLETPITDKNLVVRFIKLDRVPFLNWLAGTYSGSLLGLKALPAELLPVRSLFLSSTLLENRLQLIGEYIKDSNKVPTEYCEYIDQIKDPLEKALYMLAIFSIYYNVTS